MNSIDLQVVYLLHEFGREFYIKQFEIKNTK